MSSEEDITADSFGALKKTKRSRQRVDAGEPRNSYSSIPNFSSRPNLLNGGFNGALFAVQNYVATTNSVASASQHFFTSHDENQIADLAPLAGLNLYYSQGVVPPNKMLSGLLSRRVKTIGSNIQGKENAMMPLDIASNDVLSTISTNAYAADCITGNQSSITRISSNAINGDSNTSSGASSPPIGDTAQHMLRNILQGAVGRSNKDLYTLEKELQAVTNNNELDVEYADDTSVLNNNNISNINNNDMKLMNCVSNKADCDSESERKDDEENDTAKENLVNGNIENLDVEDDEGNESFSESHITDRISASKLDHSCNSSGSEQSVSSPAQSDISTKDNVHDMTNNNFKGEGSTNESFCDFKSTEQAKLKRARVENIVSGMRLSPLPPVNGCKKRKLYHPQQHDNSVAKRYANLNHMVDQLTDDEDETNCSAELSKKRAEKNALKNQLRMMQEQMAQMVHEYTKMQRDYQLSPVADGNGDGEEDGEGMSSGPEQDDNRSISSPEQKIQPSISSNTTPTLTPITANGPGATAFPLLKLPHFQTSTSSSINKMMNSKFIPQNMTLPPHINPHTFPSLHPNYNGALSFLQHQIFQDQQQHGSTQGNLPSHHHAHHHHSHPAFSNAAVIYQKLIMEQEARMAKEAALAAAAAAVANVEHSGQIPNAALQPPQLANTRSNSGKESSLSVRSKRSHSPSSQTTQNTSTNQHGKTSDLMSEQPTPAKTTTVAGNSTRENSFDLEGLADALKAEITSTLSNLIDTIVSRFLHQRRISSKSSTEAALAAEQLNKDLLLASQLLDRKSPRTKVIDRGSGGGSSSEKSNSGTNGYSTSAKSNAGSHSSSFNLPSADNLNALNLSSARSALGASLFPQPPKINTPTTVAMNSSAAYSSMNGLGNSHFNTFGCLSDSRKDIPGTAPEQNEALSLVVGPTKKKRSKVTDTRITPRTVSRILAQDGIGCPPGPPPPLPSASSFMDSPSKFGNVLPPTNGGTESLLSKPFHIPHPAPMLPVSLPTSVAIPNPGLHESQVFSPYSPFYGQHQGQHPIPPLSPPNMSNRLGDSPPLPHHSSLFHPALLAAAQHQQQQSQSQHQQRASSSPDFMRPNSQQGGESMGPGSDCNSMDYEGMTPTSSTLSPMHLRKAKLMFFWVRYPTSAVLKMYFPDIKFNKNNTAQLVKWFSNFREFYYIQMEKYARAEIANGTKNPDELEVSTESDIYRVLNLHYNRNNHIEVPPNFRYVVEQTLKEFFKAIQIGKDQDQSWKKPIYKVIGRLDDQVPEYFKSPNFLEQLE